MPSTNKIIALAAILALPTTLVAAKQNLRQNKRQLRRGQINHVNGPTKNYRKKKEVEEGGALEEDVEFFSNLMRRTQDMSIPNPTPSPTFETFEPTTGSTPSSAIDKTLIPTPLVDPTDPPVGETLIPTLPPQDVTTPMPTPSPVPDTGGFNCPAAVDVGCTAVDPSNPIDECDIIGEPCVDGNEGEFCCIDTCPRNYCTAKQAITTFVFMKHQHDMISIDMEEVADTLKDKTRNDP